MTGNRDPSSNTPNQLPPPGRANYDTEETKHEGLTVLAFVKWSEDEHIGELIENEAAVGTEIDRMGTDASPPFRAPTVYSAGEGRIAREWLPGQPLSEANPLPMSVPQAIASIAATFDRRGAGSTGAPRFNFFETQQETRTRIEQELMKSVENGIVREKVVQDGLALFDELYPTLTSCWQHADLVPEHLYPEELNTDGSDPNKGEEFGIVMIDAEHMRDDWPKCYDVGNSLARNIVYYPDHAFAAELLAAYLGASDDPPEAIVQPLKAILAYRSLAAIKKLGQPLDELRTAQIDRAQKLLAELPGVKTMDDLVRLVGGSEPGTAGE